MALDGEHDYDPFWKRCAELGVSIACHGGSSGSDRHASRINYTFNHIGTFATHGEFFCRSLFFGGVSRRFPTLNFAFLEGGVGWACSLYNSIFEHWEKRNRHCMAHLLDPRVLDVDLLIEMSKKYPNSHITPERVRDEFSAMRSRLPRIGLLSLMPTGLLKCPFIVHPPFLGSQCGAAPPGAGAA